MATKKTAKKTSNRTPKPTTKKTPKTKKTSTTTKKNPEKKKRTVRERALVLMRDGQERTSKEIQMGINLSHGLKPTLDAETENKTLQALSREGVQATVYRITKKGITLVRSL